MVANKHKEMELDSGLPLLIGRTIKAVKVEDGKLWLGFEDGTVTVMDNVTLQADTDDWVF